MSTSIMKYFEFSHLPEHLQAVSGDVYALACSLDAQLPDGAEKSAGLRKLLEAKDCFVRARLTQQPRSQERVTIKNTTVYLDDAHQYRFDSLQDAERYAAGLRAEVQSGDE